MTLTLAQALQDRNLFEAALGRACDIFIQMEKEFFQQKAEIAELMNENADLTKLYEATRAVSSENYTELCRLKLKEMNGTLGAPGAPA